MAEECILIEHKKQLVKCFEIYIINKVREVTRTID